MKTAYSMLLGEYVEPKQVEHADTIGFQIVCPCCKDAVFKVARTGSDTAVEYFSHHRKSKEIVEECELRVAGISDQSRLSSNALSRGQTLKAFQAVLRDALSLEAPYPASKSEIEDLHRSHLSNPAYNVLITEFTDWMASGDSDEHVETLVDTYMRSLSEMGATLTTAFSSSIQRRIAIDLYRHLCARHAERSRRFAAIHAILLEQTSTAHLVADGRMSEGDRVRADFYAGLPYKSPYVVSSTLSDSDDAGSIFGGLMRHLLGALLRLPYHQMLQNHRNGLPLISGIARSTNGVLMGLSLPGASDVAVAPGR